MLSTILPEQPVSIKTREFESDHHAKFKTNEGSLVIRLGLNGIDSVEIQADESEVQVQLLDLWASVRPAVNVALVSLR